MADREIAYVWQRHYQIIAGINSHVCESLVDDVLKICEKELVELLLGYHVYTPKSYKVWEEESKKILKSQDPELLSFVHRVAKELDLDTTIAWSVICNFLIFDFYGKVDELKTVIKCESNINQLLTQLWIFYTTDRMFLLKSLRFIFEKVTDDKFMYHHKFHVFLKSINLTKLWNNLLTNFENLLIEIDRDKCFRVSDDTLSKWVKRNNREQVELLMLMMHVVDFKEEIDGFELQKVLKICLGHSFGRNPIFDGSSSYSRPNDLYDIETAEIGLMFAVISRYWKKMLPEEPVPREFESDLEFQTIDANNLVLFALSIYKTTISDEHIEYSTRMLEALLQRLVFKQLVEFLSSEMFQDTTLKDVLLECVNKLFIELLTLTDDRKLLFEQEGFVQVICEIYKKPFLDGMMHLGVFMEMGLNMFPYRMNDFLDMAEAIMASDQYPKVMKLLQNCPNYCSGKPWEFVLANTIRLTQAVQIFPNSCNFLVPAGTLMEKYDCFGETLTSYRFKFNFFVLMEELIKLLSTGIGDGADMTHEDVLCYVSRATKFLGFLVKNYQGVDFDQDEILMNLLQRIDYILTFNCLDLADSYDVVGVYFETKCALIKYRNVHVDVAFPVLVRKRLFPKITIIEDPLKIVRKLHAHDDLTLVYALLKEEESYQSHKLVIEFTELLGHLLEVDTLSVDIMYSGVLYLLYIVFPNHKQWNYDNAEPFQENQVLNSCLNVFIKILQKRTKLVLSPVEKQLYEWVNKAFLNESHIINSFYNIFNKDKNYLFYLMHQESNWVGGKTKRVLETARLELVLLLLMIKSRAKLTEPGNWRIDEHLPKFAKSVSTLFVTPFSSTLAALSGKFLEVLARNGKIPLMACLGLDYDQIHTLFLERLRDPMEDEQVKINILDIISTCITSQRGMTAAFFNVQTSKKWHNPDIKKIEGDAVSDFMMDYLNNIKKDMAYLNSPLQVGILKIMSKLWQSQMYDLIKNLTATKDFWTLIVDPLMNSFQQGPPTYTCILIILTRQIEMILKRIGKEDQTVFFRVVEKFFANVEQLKLFQQYLTKIFAKGSLSETALNERKDLISAWTELLLVMQKQDKIKWFSTTEDYHYTFIEIAFDVFLKPVVHQNIRTTWLQMLFVTIDKIGMAFEDKNVAMMEKILAFCRVIDEYYVTFPLKDRTLFWAIFLKIVAKLKPYFETQPEQLIEILMVVGPSMNTEYNLLKEKVWTPLERGDGSIKEFLQPWIMLMNGMNYILSNKLDNRSVWFSYQECLEKMMECCCKFLNHKDAFVAGKIALRCIILYAASPMYDDFQRIDMIKFFDNIESTVATMITGVNKTNVLEHKKGWTILNLMFKFNQELYLDRFQDVNLNHAFGFLRLNTNILLTVMTIPERTVDLNALDLLTRVMQFYNQLFGFRTISHCFLDETIDYICRLVNSVMYVCLRPKHIAFYYLDNFSRLKNMKLEAKKESDELTILIMDRLIGILGLCFSCLYRLNHSMMEILNSSIRISRMRILIDNDFTVPRFELPILHYLTYGKVVCLAHFLCKTLSQIEHKKTPEIDIDESVYYKNHIGFVEHQDLSDLMPNKKLSSFLRWNPADDKAGSSDPWLANLNYQNVLTTTEKLMVFIGQQAVFRSSLLIDPDNVVYFRRNLYSELLFFYDFARKRTAERLTTPPTVLGSHDMEVIRKYLTSNWKNNKEEIMEKNFLLIIWFWFPNVCQAQ